MLEVRVLEKTNGIRVRLIHVGNFTPIFYMKPRSKDLSAVLHHRFDSATQQYEKPYRSARFCKSKESQQQEVMQAHSLIWEALYRWSLEATSSETK